jgi:2'-5' RNA ligase
LFVALAVPEAVRAALGAAQRDLRRIVPPESAAWSRPEGMHVTIRFVGSIDAVRATRLERALAANIRGFGALDLDCRGLGCFPDARAPRVVWAGVHDTDGRLLALHHAVDRAIEEFAERSAEATFVGHVTIARLKRLERSESLDLARFLEDGAERRFGAWRCEEVRLMRSELSDGAHRYTTMARVRLG